MVASNLERSRHLRISAEHDDTLQRLARAEGCSVSDLIRRAVIRTFFVADDATQRGEIMDTVAPMPEVPTPANAAPSVETPIGNGVSAEWPRL